MSFYIISKRFKSGLWTPEPFRGGCTCVLKIIVLVHNPPAKSKQPQALTLPSPCLTVSMMFLWWSAVLALCQMCGTHVFQKVTPMTYQSIEYYFQSLGGHIHVFGKCMISLCVLFGHQWFVPSNSPIDAIFAQCLSYCGRHLSKACRSLDVLGSFVTLWMNWCTLGKMLVDHCSSGAKTQSLSNVFKPFPGW